MTNSPAFDPVPALAPVCAFAGGVLNRAEDLRADSDWIRQALGGRTSRALAFFDGRALMAVDPELAPRWLTAPEIAPYLAEGLPLVFLGLDGDKPRFAIDVSGLAEDKSAAPFAELGKYIDLRSIALQTGGHDLAELAQAGSLFAWHARHGFCAVCGAPTKMHKAGYARRCKSPDCGAEHFPRTDPVVIMLAISGDRCLIGRQPGFVPGVFSALAGFMEPGESIEEAVRRELDEEAKIAVGAVRYYASQPWPFPSSLMIGCYAEALSEDATPDGVEIEELCWVSRADAAAVLAGATDRGFLIPPPIAIAHQLIRGWVQA